MAPSRRSFVSLIADGGSINGRPPSAGSRSLLGYQPVWFHGASHTVCVTWQRHSFFFSRPLCRFVNVLHGGTPCVLWIKRYAQQVWCLASDIWYIKSGGWCALHNGSNLISEIRCLIRHLMSEIRCLMFDAWCLMFHVVQIGHHIWCLMHDMWSQPPGSDAWLCLVDILWRPIVCVAMLWYLRSCFWYPISDISCLMFDIWCKHWCLHRPQHVSDGWYMTGIIAYGIITEFRAALLAENEQTNETVYFGHFIPNTVSISIALLCWCAAASRARHCA